MKLIEESRSLLSKHGYRTISAGEGLLFEDRTVFGFIRQFESVAKLINGWEDVEADFVDQWSRQIRTASSKRWNAYLCLLSQDDASEAQRGELSKVEEDLTSTRKVAEDAVTTSADLKRALFPLLPIQSLASVEEEDIGKRLSNRASVSGRLVEAFRAGKEPEYIAEMLLQEGT